MDISVDGRTLVFLLLGAMILVISIILLFRNIIGRKASEDLAEKYSGKKWASPLEGRVKILMSMSLHLVGHCSILAWSR